MAKTPISITNFVAICKTMPAWKSILVRAGHGVGKSAIISQIADYHRQKDFDGKDYPLIDRRLSQLSEGDMVGLPVIDGETTRFNPPDWVKKACDEPCALFLDELNRATPEVMQAAFQLVLDRQLQGWKLHPQTRVYAAVNTGAGYTVNEMDPALLDRFWAVDLEATPEEWLAWAKNQDDICGHIIDFIQLNQAHLDPPASAEPGTVQASRRSWHHLSRALLANDLSEKPGDPLFYPLCLGFIGLESTMAFVDYAKNYKFDVSAEDVIERLVKKSMPFTDDKGVNHKTLDALAKKYASDEEARSEAIIAKVQLIGAKDEDGKSIDPTTYDDNLLKRLESMGQERINALAEKVAEYIKTTYANKALNDRQGAALGKFASITPPEIRLVLWQKSMERGTEDMTLNSSIHRWIAPQLLNIFGVKMGKAGMGMEAQIPDFLKQS
jgi:hypothetical protein